MKIGNKFFDIGKRTYIVGILNVTPDSFFDGGNYTSLETAVIQAKKMVDEGADIIEIGGESTRPGHKKMDDKTETGRVLPVLTRLVSELDVPISIDTGKKELAKRALEAGASMINDILGFLHEPNLAKVCAEYGAVCCTMHNRDNMNYVNFLQDVKDDLNKSIDVLLKAGVKPENIITDPGIGFAKTAEQNLEILRNLKQFTAMPYPLMLGTSRKSFMEKTVGLTMDERLEGTIATTVLGIEQGAAFIRVHDVAENKRAIKLTDAILNIGQRGKE